MGSKKVEIMEAKSRMVVAMGRGEGDMEKYWLKALVLLFRMDELWRSNAQHGDYSE